MVLGGVKTLQIAFRAVCQTDIGVTKLLVVLKERVIHRPSFVKTMHCTRRLV